MSYVTAINKRGRFPIKGEKEVYESCTSIYTDQPIQWQCISHTESRNKFLLD